MQGCHLLSALVYHYRHKFKVVPEYNVEVLLYLGWVGGRDGGLILYSIIHFERSFIMCEFCEVFSFEPPHTGVILW